MMRFLNPRISLLITGLFILFSPVSYSLSGQIESNRYINPEHSFTVCLPYKNAIKGISDKKVNSEFSWVDFKHAGDLRDYLPYYSLEFYKLSHANIKNSSTVFYDASNSWIRDDIQRLQTLNRNMRFSVGQGIKTQVAEHLAYQKTVSITSSSNPQVKGWRVYTNIFFPKEGYIIHAIYDGTSGIYGKNTLEIPWNEYRAFMRSLHPGNALPAC